MEHQLSQIPFAVTHTPHDFRILTGELPAFGEFVGFIGLPEVRAAEQRYTATDG